MGTSHTGSRVKECLEGWRLTDLCPGWRCSTPGGTASPGGAQDSPRNIKKFEESPAFLRWPRAARVKDFPEAEPFCVPVHPKTSGRCGRALVNVPGGQAWAPNTCRTLYSWICFSTKYWLSFFFFLFGSSHHWALPFRWISNLTFLIFERNSYSEVVHRTTY